MRRGPSRARTRRRAYSASGLVVAFCVMAGAVRAAAPEPASPVVAEPVAPVVTTSPAPEPSPTVARVLPAAAAPDELPVISYLHVPHGFPADPAPDSLLRLSEGLHPYRKVALYDSPGGKPRAFLPPE